MTSEIFVSITRKLRKGFNKLNFLPQTVQNKFHMDNSRADCSGKIIMAVPPIVATFRQAILTFSPAGERRKREDFDYNLNKLKCMMDNLRPEDVGLDPSLTDPALWKNPSKAPCTYIELFKNRDVSLSIFVLKPGFKMPLHDHPQMHGLLKVIHGGVNTKCYTEYALTGEEIHPKSCLQGIKEKVESASPFKKYGRKLFAQITSDTVCTANSGTCVLGPQFCNYHEIEALEYPAAFFDILSPPYESLDEEFGPRTCHYYRVINKISTNLVQLEEISPPKTFYCDQSPYLGPLLL